MTTAVDHFEPEHSPEVVDRDSPGQNLRIEAGDNITAANGAVQIKVGDDFWQHEGGARASAFDREGERLKKS